MSKTDFQNGFALGLASGGVVKVDNAKEEQVKTIDITENGTTEVIPDEDKVLSKVAINVYVPSGGASFGALDNTVTFIVDDELYESVSVKSGNSVFPPAVSPHREGYYFSHWSYNDDYMPNPFTPTEDTTITAVMYESLDAVYKMNGISREEYPEFIIFRYGTSSYTWGMYIAQEGDLSAREGNDGLKDGVYLTIPADAPYYWFVDNDYQGTEPEKAIEEFIPNTETTATQHTGKVMHFIGEDSNCVFYTNTRLSLSRGEWYSFG